MRAAEVDTAIPATGRHHEMDLQGLSKMKRRKKDSLIVRIAKDQQRELDTLDRAIEAAHREYPK